MRLDAHVHIDKVYGSKKANEVIIERDNLLSFFEKEQLTHICAYYTDYEKMKELVELKKDITFYPIKWIKSSFLEDDAIDSLQRGIKIHSIRGYNNQGIDYRGTKLKNYLKKLPSDFLVCCHMQGRSFGSEVRDEEDVARLAMEFPNLKFIINHSGGFGFKSMYPADTGRTEFMKIALGQELSVSNSALMSKRIDNLWCESSILLAQVHFKSYILAYHNKLLLGSDFPFCLNFKNSGSVLRQEAILKKVNSSLDIDLLHKRAVEWIES